MDLYLQCWNNWLPSDEPCKHQHAVANKYKLNSPNLIPLFNARGRYLHAVIALGEARAGSEAFYANLLEKDVAMIYIYNISMNVKKKNSVA